jgi:hypothetical protein
MALCGILERVMARENPIDRERGLATLNRIWDAKMENFWSKRRARNDEAWERYLENDVSTPGPIGLVT